MLITCTKVDTYISNTLWILKLTEQQTSIIHVYGKLSVACLPAQCDETPNEQATYITHMD
jgi:hypothetical protein